MVDPSAAIQELARRELARRELLSFTTRFHRTYDPSWFHHRLASRLDQFLKQVEAKAEPRLIVTVPPRHGKSTLVSEMFPPFILGRHPEWDVIMATYNQTIADMFGRKVRDRLNDPTFLDLFSATLDPSANAADLVKTKVGGMYKSTGVGGSLTSMGAHVLIVDDPIKDREEADSKLMRDRLWDWYTGVARTRMHPGGGIVVVHTRWSVDDLIGRLIVQSKGDPDADQWEVIDFPAIATHDEEFRKAGEALHPNRYPVKTLRRIKASLPARDWEALYQCSPFVAEGGFFRRDEIRWYNEADRPKELGYILAADYATSAKASSDHTCILAAGVDHQKNIYIHDTPIYSRVEPRAAVTKTVQYAKRLGTNILTHEKGVIANTLEPLFRDVMQEEGHWLVFEKYTRSSQKHVYALAIKGMMEAGKVYLPARHRDWMEPLLLRFMPDTDGEDDFIDALASIGLAIQKGARPPMAPKTDSAPTPETPDEYRSRVAREEYEKRKRGDEPEDLDDWG